MSPTEATIWPMIAHVALVFCLYLLLSARRMRAVRQGQARPEQFRENREEPAASLVVKNAIANQFELPVLFENVGSNYAAALNPGVTNLVSLPLANGTTHLVVPDPEGPDQPTDVWAAATKSALEALGTASNPVQVTFVDVFYSYHDLLGEIHCGTNNVRTPPAGNWWD